MQSYTEPLTLSELSDKIRLTLVDVFPFSVPVIAEISELNINKNGHCYIELIEHNNGQIVSRMRAIIYANRLPMIQSYFSSITGSTIEVGLKVLVMARISYHNLYGLSVEINDIDPKYTLGDMEQRKQLIINKLIDTGVADQNKQLPIPKVIKNIAVISSSTAAGYGDFVTHLETNQYNFSFQTTIFEAFMQGNQAVESITKAIYSVFDSDISYDVIAIIRGGGSKAELAIFDNFDIAYLITQLPIPVLTGIGHERDTSVLDFVANQGLKTPTAVADFIIATNVEALNHLNTLESELYEAALSALKLQHSLIVNLEHRLSNIAHKIGSTNRERLVQLRYQLTLSINNFLAHNHKKIDNFKGEVERAIKQIFRDQHSQLVYSHKKIELLAKMWLQHHYQKLNLSEQRIKLSDPSEILERGYALLAKNGKRITDSTVLEQGDYIQIHTINKVIGADITDIKHLTNS